MTQADHDDGAMAPIGRRHFALGTLAGMALPLLPRLAAGAEPAMAAAPLVIRTITAFATPKDVHDHETLARAAAFLKDARARFEAIGARVQTLRVATAPLWRFHPDWRSGTGLAGLVELDRAAQNEGLTLALGSLLEDDIEDRTLPETLAELFGATTHLNAAISVADPAGGIRSKAIMTAAHVIRALSMIDPSGAGNFRFAATARCNSGIPFFPAGWHDGGAPAFAIGLESPPLLAALLKPGEDRGLSQRRLVSALGSALAPLDAMGHLIETASGWRWLGIDSSPAPGLEASIGAVIETISGEPFGGMGTLAACGFLTGILKALPVRLAGYSGLMLPTLEDPVLAKRAAEGRFGLSQLLLYSSVCGTGLDVAALPGDATAEALARIIGDVATLATKLDKPLLARLLPVPGKQAGDEVDFDHPLLTASRVMAT